LNRKRKRQSLIKMKARKNKPAKPCASFRPAPAKRKATSRNAVRRANLKAPLPPGLLSHALHAKIAFLGTHRFSSLKFRR